MNLSVVIPNYNGEDLLRKNLPKVIEAVSGYRNGRVEIIITDDASTDASASVVFRLRQDFLRRQGYGGQVNLKFIKNEKNLGFSSNVNRGVKEAKGNIIVLLNSDVIPEKGFLDPLLSHFKNDRVFAVGCMDKSVEGEKVILRGRGIAKWKRGFLVHSRGEVDKNNTFWVGGGSGAFRKDIWDKLRGFDELYNPFYWEDIDLSYRAVKSGYQILFEPKSIVVHEHEEGAIKKKYSPYAVKKIAYRNQLIFLWKNITDFNLLLSHLFYLPYHFVKASIRKDWSFFAGFIKAFNMLPKIIRSSLGAQKFFINRDKEILNEFINEK